MNMLGKQVAVNSIPFFWTTQYGKSLRYCGHALSFDDLYVDGNLDKEKLEFVAYYIREGKVLAAASIGRDPVVSAIAELMACGKMPSVAELKSGKIDMVKLAASNL